MRKLASPLPFPSRASDAHKGHVGRVLLIGGSRGMAGSIALSSIAALKTGSGTVSTAIPNRCLETVAGFHPGIMTIPVDDTEDGQFGAASVIPDVMSFDAVGCGPGMRTGPGAIRIVETLLGMTDLPRVFDADAINVVAEHQLLDCPALPCNQSHLILTPHPGELARLTGVPANQREDQIEAAELLAKKHGVTIVVKGAPTVVVGTGNETDRVQRFVNDSGNAGMATAGSGDVLTGIITSLVGQNLSAWDATRLGVFLHGTAGDLAAELYSQPGMTCKELLERLPEAILTALQSPHVGS